MMFLLFYFYLGLIIWYLKDLVNWVLIGLMLIILLGVIWVVDLCKYDDCYFIYIFVDLKGEGWFIYVIWVDDIVGLWSELINLYIDGCIDLGYIVGEDGKCYLFVNGICKIRFIDDGLVIDGELEMVYVFWCYFSDWIVENFVFEGFKLFCYNDWFYLVIVVGGMVGLVIGYMVIVVCLKFIYGFWEYCLYNFLVCIQFE